MNKILFTLAAFLFTMNAHAQTFTLKSKDLGGQATLRQMASFAGCNGDNISPQLFWENAPKETKSFAVTVYDEDAPTGSGWWHWLIFDIPAGVNELKSGAGTLQSKIAPDEAIQSKTDFGTTGYGGPCPPEGSGFHKYTVTLFALQTPKIGLKRDANPALVGFYLEQNVIKKASLVFYCGK